METETAVSTNNPYQEPVGKSCLKILYAYYFLGQNDREKAVTDILHRLDRVHGITEGEARLLAYLSSWQFSPWHDIKPVAAKIGSLIREAEKLMASLIEKGAVDRYSDRGYNIYKINSEFLLDLIREDKMAEITEKELPEIICTYASELLYQSAIPKSTIRTFERLLAVNDSMTFSRGYDQLEIRDLPLADKSCFLLLASSFLRRGIEPVRLKDFEIISASEEDSKCPHPFMLPAIEGDLDYGGSREDLIAEGLKGLLRRGLAVGVPGESDSDSRSSGRDWYLLSADACSKLFRGMDKVISYDALGRFTTLYRSDAIRKKQLFFDEAFQGRVDEISVLLDPAKYELFVKRLEEKALNNSINILFHGYPGTGKTELAMQLARSSGRDIFSADLAKLEDSYWGESEKNYRSLFRTFSYLCAVSTNPPILLLNEADGIIAKRVDVHRSSDKYSNSIQNIILEEMEHFEGVLIATTNLAGNMDKAFERRFPFKLCFSRPSPETARQIWMRRFPYLTAEQALLLAKKFPFSGGQVDNVAKRCDLFEVVNGATPSMNQITEYCQQETSESDNPVVINGFLPPKGHYTQ